MKHPTFCVITNQDIQMTSQKGPFSLIVTSDFVSGRQMTMKIRATSQRVQILPSAWMFLLPLQVLPESGHQRAPACTVSAVPCHTPLLPQLSD